MALPWGRTGIWFLSHKRGIYIYVKVRLTFGLLSSALKYSGLLHPCQVHLSKAKVISLLLLSLPGP
jgi:hypothetical protein